MDSGIAGVRVHRFRYVLQQAVHLLHESIKVRRMSIPAVTIIGCGYVGTRLAREIRSQTPALLGVVQHDTSAARLKQDGIQAQAMDLEQDASPPVTGHWVFYFAPPPSRGRADTRMANWLHSLDRQRPQKIVLISTTGVYGDCGGRWITEEEPVRPRADRAHRRLDAEQQLRRWCEAHEVGYTILRVPGIYGPQRLPVARLQQGLPVLSEAESPWSNRIHVDDLVRACMAAASSDFNAVIHVGDGQPGTMTDYFNRVADALGLPRPEQISLEEAKTRLGAGMLSYLAESRRLDISRMRTVLGVEPQYPDLDRGLKTCIASSPSAT